MRPTTREAHQSNAIGERAIPIRHSSTMLASLRELDLLWAWYRGNERLGRVAQADQDPVGLRAHPEVKRRDLPTRIAPAAGILVDLECGDLERSDRRAHRLPQETS